MTEKTKNQKGFTLLELLIAMSLLAIGLLATAGMQGVALNANSLANKMSIGTALAQQVEEDIMSWSRTDARLRTAVGAANYRLDPLHNSDTITVPGSGRYSATYDITPNFNGTNNLTRIKVDIIKMDVTLDPDNPLDFTDRGEVRVFTSICYKRLE